MIFNNYYDPNNKWLPYAGSTAINKGSIAPAHCIRGSKPEQKKGFWPCADIANGAFIYEEDHRGETGYVAEEPFVIMELGKH